MMNAQDIKELRLKLGLSQTQLAKKLGVSIMSVSRWENGRSKPLPAFERKLKRLK